MDKIRLAVVEDDQLYLDDRCENLAELKDDCTIEVVIKAHNAEEFFAEYRKNPDNVDALILDIDLTGSYTGLQIAEKVLKPSLFVSGYNKVYLDKIEDLSDRINVVMHVTKPVSDERFKNRIKDFCREIRLHQNHVEKLTFRKNGEVIEFPVNEIAFIESVPNTTNKTFYFRNKPPKTLKDIIFSEIDGQNAESIVQIHRKFYVNKEYAEQTKYENKISVSYKNEDNETDEKLLVVSDNYKNNLK